jgi:hypothetical protein
MILQMAEYSRFTSSRNATEWYYKWRNILFYQFKECHWMILQMTEYSHFTSSRNATEW